jgi:hypothetical protein
MCWDAARVRAKMWLPLPAPAWTVMDGLFRLYGFLSDRTGKRDIRVGQGRIEGQMNRRLPTAVPVTVRHACGEDDERAGAAVIPFAIDLDAHRSPQDVEDLIDLVDVHTRRRASTDRRLDAIDRAGLGARGVIEQRLRQAFVRAALVDSCKIDHTYIFHSNLPPESIVLNRHGHLDELAVSSCPP